LFRVNRKTGQVVMKFAAAYESLTDDKAKELMREYLEVEKERVKLKESYMKKFEKVLPAKKVMRYLQVENKLEAIARYELAKGVPLAQ
jgi:vacuolar-type H+-ATPase subunit D/Vma8